MTCFRCDGLMVSITLKDTEGSSDSCNGWQCLLCGDITDSVITTNRKVRHEARRYEPRLQGHVNRSAKESRA